MSWISKHSSEHKANLLNDMPVTSRASNAPMYNGDGKKLKSKIKKLSAKHKGLYDSVVEGHGQNEYTSGNYDKDYKRLGKVEDKLERKEQKYMKKFGTSPYQKKNWIQDATASIKARGTEGVCTGDKFGSSSCPPGSKRYNLAKTFKKMAKNK